MREARTIEAELAPALEALGLFSFGWFVMSEAPFSGPKAMIVGNREKNGRHKMWQVFSSSPEHDDGLPDPLNRWTERKVGRVASDAGAVALYPFGETVWPFQHHARQATGMKASPLGILIHPDHGLWQAFRAILVFDEKISLEPVLKTEHPCDMCEDKPCLVACPVDAFSTGSLNVASCFSHLDSGEEPLCMEAGCRARAACPVGLPYTLAQLRFHMASYRGK